MDFDPSTFVGDAASIPNDTNIGPPNNGDFDPVTFVAPTSSVDSYLPKVDTSPNQSVGQPLPTEAEVNIKRDRESNTPTLSPITDETEKATIGSRPDAWLGKTNLDYNTEQQQNEFASQTRSALEGVTMAAAPYALAGLDAVTGKTPFEVGLHQWNDLYQHAAEDSPIANQLGSIVGFSVLPIGKLGLIGNTIVGAAASGLSTWLGSEMTASKGDVAKSMALGGAMAGMMGVSAKAFGPEIKGYVNTIKPIVLTPQAVSNFNESLNSVYGTIEGPIPVAPSLIPRESIRSNPQGVARVLKVLSEDPLQVPKYEVSNLKDVHPVGHATVTVLPDGTMEARLNEVSGQGVGTYKETLESPSDIKRFRQELANAHPNTAIHLDDLAKEQALKDDEVWGSFFPRPTEKGGQVSVYKKAESGDVTGNYRAPISVADEAPTGNPTPKPALASLDNDGFLSIHDLDSPKAQEQSLIGRNIMAVKTPKGVRYVSAFADAEKGFTSVRPFDAEEGIKTVAGVSRVPNYNLRELTANELKKVVEQAKVQRESGVAQGNDPDVHVRLNREKYDYSAPETVVTKLEGNGNNIIPPPVAPEPMPPPPPGPPPKPPPFDQPTWDVINSFKSRNGPAIYEKLRRLFVPEHLRADFDLGNLISDMQSSKALVAHQVSLQKALERNLGKDITPFREDVQKWFEAKVTDEVMASKYPEAWNAKREILLDAKKTRDAQHQRIQELGGIHDESFNQEEGDLLLNKYATRTYAQDTLPPGKWLKIVEKDQEVWNRAIEGFKQWEKDAGRKPLSDADAAGKIREALGSKDSASILFGASKGKTNNPIDSLSFRRDLPEWYRNLRGQNRDGFFSIARTDATQKAIIRNLEIWEKVAANPEWSLKSLDGLAPEVAKTWKQLTDNQRWFGKASGSYVAPEVYDSLVTLSNAHYEGNKIAQAFVGLQKTNWFSLGRMRTYVATMVDNWFHGIMSGGVDLSRPLATGNAMGHTIKSMLSYRKNPLASDEFSKFIQDARRIGVDEPGHIGTDLSSVARRQEQYFMEKMAKLPTGSSYPTFLNAMTDAHASITKPGSWVFETADRLHRLASWKMITDDLMSQPTMLKSLYAQWHGSMPPLGLADKELAMRIAARNVFEYFPMYGRAAPAAKYISKSAVGIAAPTAMFGMERNRIYGSIPFNIVRDPRLKFRLAKWGTIGAGLFGASGALRNYFNEVSDADVDAAMQERGLSQRMFSPASWVLPVRVGGKVAIMDFTQMSGPLQYLSGDPSLGPVAKSLLTAGTSVLQGGGAGVAADYLLDKAGIQTGLPKYPPLPGTNPVVNVAQAGINAGLIPAAIPEIYNNLSSTGMMGSLSRKQETEPTGVAVARNLGVPITTSSVGMDKNPSFQGRIGEDTKAMFDAINVLKMAAQMPVDKKVPLLQKVINSMANNPTPEKVKIMRAAKEMILEAGQGMKRTADLENKAKESHRPIGMNQETKPEPRRIGGVK